MRGRIGNVKVGRWDRVEDFENDLLVAVRHHVEGAVDALVGGDLVRLEPATI
jgi:hypothetical protein